ncbi:hypothetical protein SSSM5_051 [Synechococcus phage S-SSM5]|uniref:Uncharacterized protein n=1 Tax=Synechococcus phage S-SSM5 TaxID=445685 RepID=E3SK91_9CAUD|nr:hypothetical protein SSSM5_051 [Synechococcus phage S-SSM5]ADO98019.1 hypothetical protein SSSM5_051 [Synechococcus phage S-SSM5]
MVTNEVTTLSVNLFEISEQKEEPIVQTGGMTTMKKQKSQNLKGDEQTVSNLKMTVGENDFDEFERIYEDIEYDDGTAVDYDLDYTHSV